MLLGEALLLLLVVLQQYPLLQFLVLLELQHDTFDGHQAAQQGSQSDEAINSAL